MGLGKKEVTLAMELRLSCTNPSILSLAHAKHSVVGSIVVLWKSWAEWYI